MYTTITTGPDLWRPVDAASDRHQLRLLKQLPMIAHDCPWHCGTQVAPISSPRGQTETDSFKVDALGTSMDDGLPCPISAAGTAVG